jgi:hypothetical protein
MDSVVGQARGDPKRSQIQPWLVLALAMTAVGVYACIFGLTRSREVQELQAGIAELDAQRAALAAAASRRLPTRDHESSSGPDEDKLVPVVPELELVPTVSSLGRRSGIRIASVKQISADRNGQPSRAQVRAKANFSQILRLLDELATLSPSLILDEIFIRRAEDGERVELDVELSVAVADSVSDGE